MPPKTQKYGQRRRSCLLLFSDVDHLLVCYTPRQLSRSGRPAQALGHLLIPGGKLGQYEVGLDGVKRGAIREIGEELGVELRDGVIKFIYVDVINDGDDIIYCCSLRVEQAVLESIVKAWGGGTTPPPNVDRSRQEFVGVKIVKLSDLLLTQEQLRTHCEDVHSEWLAGFRERMPSVTIGNAGEFVVDTIPRGLKAFSPGWLVTSEHVRDFLTALTEGGAVRWDVNRKEYVPFYNGECGCRRVACLDCQPLLKYSLSSTREWKVTLPEGETIVYEVGTRVSGEVVPGVRRAFETPASLEKFKQMMWEACSADWYVKHAGSLKAEWDRREQIGRKAWCALTVDRTLKSGNFGLGGETKTKVNRSRQF